MTVEQLTDWKIQIFTHQQQVLKESQPQQTTLFDLAPVHCDPDLINPFSLQVHNSQFSIEERKQAIAFVSISLLTKHYRFCCMLGKPSNPRRNDG